MCVCFLIGGKDEEESVSIDASELDLIEVAIGAVLGMFQDHFTGKLLFHRLVVCVYRGFSIVEKESH